VEITGVRVKVVGGGDEKLLGFASITIDGLFVVRDLKIIRTPHGLFVAMPNRKLMYRCAKCGCKNHLRATFCNRCGGKLEQQPTPHRRGTEIPKLHADIAHPITPECREQIQQAVVAEYHREFERTGPPPPRGSRGPPDTEEHADAGPEVGTNEVEPPADSRVAQPPPAVD